MKHFRAFLERQYEEAGALTPQKKLEVIQRLRQAVHESGQVPLSESKVVHLPLEHPAVQAALHGEPVSLGGTQVRSREVNKTLGIGLLVGSLLLVLGGGLAFAISLVRGKGTKAQATVTVSSPTVTTSSVASSFPLRPSPTPLPSPSPTPTVPPITPSMPASTPMGGVVHNAQSQVGQEPQDPVSVQIGQQAFILEAKPPDKDGLWKVQGPTWLAGTYVRKVFALPASQVPEVPAGTRIWVRLRNGQVWEFQVERMLQINPWSTEIYRQQHPGVVILLVPEEGGKDNPRTVLLAAPLFPEPKTTAPNVTEVWAVVIDGPLRLRAKPEGEVLALLPTGARLRVTGPTVNGKRYVWVPVEVEVNGQVMQGWVAQPFIQTFP